jgi:hypothetical protein
MMPHLSGDVANALRYWEPRDLAFNGALTAVVLVHFYDTYVGTAFAAAVAHFVVQGSF